MENLLKNLGIGEEEGDENIVVDLSGQSNSEKSQLLRLAINDYVNERLSVIGN